MKNTESRLTLIEGTEYIKKVGRLKKKKQKWAQFQCTCVRNTEAPVSGVKRNRPKSCGCLKIEISTTHGMPGKGNRTYQTWRAMRRRCLDIKHKFYPTYSKLGICKNWVLSFESFLEDMGERPIGKSLDRIDNTKGYFKANCRWATQKQQCRNKKNNKIVSFQGKQLPLYELSEKFNVKITLLYNRLQRKWTIEKALETPLQKNKIRKR